MTRTAGTRCALEAWTAETLRLTTFHVPKAIDNAEGWWKELTGSDPESSINKRRLGLRADAGSHGQAMLAMQVIRPQNRVDWIMSVAQDVDPENVPTANAFPQRSREFSDLMVLWLKTCPALHRIAFGAVLMMNVPSESDGHGILSNYLDFDIGAGISSDFLYQANRRTKSNTVPEVGLNRLTRWSVGQYVLHAITLSQDGAAFEPTRVRHHCSCRLELDINTVLEDPPNPIHREQLAALWMELVQRGTDIARDGDIP